MTALAPRWDADIKNWLLENKWGQDDAVRRTIQSYPPLTALSVRKLWTQAQRTLYKTPLWKGIEKRMFREACQELKKKELSTKEKHVLVHKTIRLSAQVLLYLLEMERDLVNQGQFITKKFWEFQELSKSIDKLRQDHPLLTAETEEDQAFLLYFNLVKLPSQSLEQNTKFPLPKEDALEWGKSLLRKGKISKELAPFASRYFTLIQRQVDCNKITKVVHDQLLLHSTKANFWFTHQQHIKLLASSLTPCLLHLNAHLASWENVSSQNSSAQTQIHPLYLPKLFTFLDAHAYHKRQTILYNLLFEHLSPHFTNNMTPIGTEKFRKRAPRPFEDREWQQQITKTIAQLTTPAKKREKKSIPPPPLPLQRPLKVEEEETPKETSSPSHIEVAIRCVLGNAGTDPFQENEAERVSRWFAPDAVETCVTFSDKDKMPYVGRTPYARKIITFVHAFPRKLRHLLAHPHLRKIFSIKTGSGCAMMVDVRTRLDLFSSPGVLEMSWILQEDVRSLYHYMWVPSAHAQSLLDDLPFPDDSFVRLGQVLKEKRTEHLPGTFQLLSGHKVAIWDDHTRLWYVVWPVVRDLRELELDFSNPQSMAKDGFWT